MKIGYINYLNCYPFYHHMFKKEPLEGIDVVPAYPEDLNRMMASGELSVSPISSAAYPGMRDRVLMLPGFCLSSIGYVRSVILASRVPIEDLDGRTVGLTTASRTSVTLVRILLEKYYGLRPEYVPVKPVPDMEAVDAAVVIGNEAMLEGTVPVEYIYDVGDLWLRKTGHPVVFAVFAVRDEAALNERDSVERVIRSYTSSLAELRDNEDAVVSSASGMYPDIKYDIARYYRLLKFEFSDDLKKALMFFFESAADAGLLERVNSINFYQ
ncbi:MAG: menaquinone biosynthesis protein [Spirochaetes bacterium]|jgi:chorismate dehydratase|nr:menaquinone biosynthesis protein [Spirochaetota bacterium]